MTISNLSINTQQIIKKDLIPNISKINKIPTDIIKKIIPIDLQKNFPEITAKLIEDAAKTNLSKKTDDNVEKSENEHKIDKINEVFAKLETAMASLQQVKIYKVPDRSKSLHFAPISALIAKATVLKGAMKDWSPLRLLSGKHASWVSLGAEHLMLNNRLGDTIDATYVDVKHFSEALHKFGGEKCLFKPEIEPGYINPFKGKYVKIKLPEDREIKALKIDFTAKSLDKTNQMIRFYNNFGFKIFIEHGEPGGFYVISKDDLEAMYKSPFMNSAEKPEVEELTHEEENLFNQLSTPFRGYYFEQYNPEFAKVLDNLGLNETPWVYKEIGGHGFLVREEDLGKVKMLEKKSNLARYPITAFEPKETGTVLMAMNQMEVYEQYGPEMLTFLLEDANVMSYNNAGKGLSNGNTDIANVKEAAEVAYQFLHQVKKIPDEKILAKGQCFGGAPTAWLGAQHADINLMIDQAPANFHEVAKREFTKFIQVKKNSIKDHNSLQYKALEQLETSKTVSDVAKAIMMGFDAAEDIKKNQGNNLIHINLPTLEGVGGDQLVPEHHPELMIDSFAMKPDKLYKLSVNEGGIHVVDWFSDPDSYKTILQFLQKTNLAPDVSYRQEEINKVIDKRRQFEAGIQRQMLKAQKTLDELNQRKQQGIEIKQKDIDPMIHECVKFKTAKLKALAKAHAAVHDISLKETSKDDEFSRLMIDSVLIKPLKQQLSQLDKVIQELESLLTNPPSNENSR